MPPKKFFRHKKKYTPRKKSEGHHALVMVKKLKRQLAPEWKSLDTVQSAAGVPNTYVFSPLCQLGEGDDIKDRTARQVLAKRINIRGTITINALVAQTHYRQLLIIDRMQNGTAPTAAQLFDTTTGAGTWYYLRNISSIDPKRFKVLHDRTFVLCNQGTFSYSWKINKRLNHKVKFIGTTSATTNFGTGQIYLVEVASSASAPTVEWSARFRYTDA